jgi:hypothetical protein
MIAWRVYDISYMLCSIQGGFSQRQATHTMSLAKLETLALQLSIHSIAGARMPVRLETQQSLVLELKTTAETIDMRSCELDRVARETLLWVYAVVCAQCLSSSDGKDMDFFFTQLNSPCADLGVRTFKQFQRTSLESLFYGC